MIRNSNELSLTRQPPGHLPVWVEVVIALGCVITFISTSLGTQLLWEQLPTWIDLGLLRNGLTFFVTFCMLAALLPPWRMSRMVRLAVMLPLIHAVAIAIAWPAWLSVSAYVNDEAAATGFARDFPIVGVIVGAIAVFGGISAAAAKRRSGEWVHGFTMLALAELLLIGLWLPLAVQGMPGGHDWDWYGEPLLVDPWFQIGFAVVPPTLAAVAFTVFALRRPRALQQWRPMITYAVVALFAVATLLRANATGRMLLLYTNFLPLVLAAAAVAVIAVITLGAVTWWRSWSAQRAFMRSERRGATIADDGDEAALGMEITSWLRGPRIVQRPFIAATSSGQLPVLGAHLVAAMPLATTQLRTGEVLGVLRPRDDIQIAGLDTSGGDPFRTSAAPLADGVRIAPAALEGGGFASAALVLWRPCVAYLLIVTAIAIPALAALVVA